MRLAVLFVLAALPAAAAVIEVPGDYETIQPALDAAAPGDTVLLTWVYYEGEGNRDLDFRGKALVLRSQLDDPQACMIDLQGSEDEPRRGFWFHSGETEDTRIEGLSIVSGWQPQEWLAGGGGAFADSSSRATFARCDFAYHHGSALFCNRDSGFLLEDCRFFYNQGRNGGAAQCLEGFTRFENCQFFDNGAELAGAAIHGHGAAVEAQDCFFKNNDAPVGAALDFIYGAEVRFEDCFFQQNEATENYWSVIVNLHGMVDASFEGCTFAWNRTGPGGSVVITSKSSHGEVLGCTFWRNDLDFNGTALVLGESTGRVENTIIAGTLGGQALIVSQAQGIRCNDLWGNELGDWTGPLAPYLGVDGNISEDPLFCDPNLANFMLHENSPCAPGGDCDLMGAWPVGCSTAAERSSWSRVKTLY